LKVLNIPDQSKIFMCKTQKVEKVVLQTRTQSELQVASNIRKIQDKYFSRYSSVNNGSYDMMI
jgi:hypothetical protein